MSQEIASFEIRLDKNGTTPLYRQVGDALLTLIESGVLTPDTRLPAIRKFAGSLGVNNVTIVNAYRYLESKKAVYSITGSGTYVSKLNISGRETVGLNSAVGKTPAGEPDIGVVADFSKGSSPQELFPVREFKLLFNEVLERDRGNAFSYEESQGYLPLRESLCSYLVGFGIQTSAERLHIISGAQQGIDVISKALLRQGDVVITERPTYAGGVASFLSRGARICDIPVERDGIDMELFQAVVRQLKPKLFYCMPYFQTPTCYSYSLEKKRLLIELAYKHDFYIIEEDNQSDFNYTLRDITPLKTLDYKNRVIYIKSFSKILMPGLRIGFMIMPRPISESTLAAKYTTDIDTSGFIQRSFQLFLKNGMFYEHVSHMRNNFMNKYVHMLDGLKKINNERIFNEPGGGLNFWLRTPENRKPEVFFDNLRGKGVLISEGAGFFPEREIMPYYKISFADTSAKEIDVGTKILTEMYK